MDSELIIVYLVAVGAVVLIANVRGLDRVRALVIALILSPVVGFLWVAFSKPQGAAVAGTASWGTAPLGTTRPSAGFCPSCGVPWVSGARFCASCGHRGSE